VEETEDMETGRVSPLEIDGIPGLVAIMTPDGAVEAANPQVSEYCGQSLEGLKNWVTNGTVHPEDVPLIAPTFTAAIGSGDPYDFACRIRRFDGVYRWFQVRGLPFRESGRIVRWYVLLIDIDDRKRAEEALAKSERDLRLIVDTIPAGAALLSATGEVEVVNEQMAGYFGKSIEELRRWGTTDAIHPDDLPRVLETMQHSLATGAPFDSEQRHRRFDGVYRWFRVRGLPIRDDGGAIVRWNILHIDIDERKRAEDELRERERQIRLIVDTIPAGAALLSATGEMQIANGQMTEYFGKPFDELKQWATTDDVHPDDRARVLESFRRSIEAGTPYRNEQRLRRADGVYRWFEVRRLPIRNADGVITQWNVLHVDIDERKRAEEELRERERQIRLIVESIPALAIVTDPVGRHAFVNKRVLDYYGKSFEEIRDWPVRPDLLHPDDLAHANEVVARTIAKDIAYQDEYRLRRHDGTYRWFEGRGLPYRDEQGRIQNWYVLLTDIDDRKRAEQALAASERNLQLIIDTTPALIWSANTEGGADSINQHYLDYVRLPLEKLRQFGWLDAVHPEDLNGLLSVWKTLLEAGTAGETETRLRRHDGVYRWFLFRVQPLRDENGRIVKWHGVNIDIEDRKQAEDELRQSEAFLAQGEAVSETGSFLWNLELESFRWSEQLYRIFEWENGSPVTTERIATRVHPQDLADVEEMVKRAQAGLNTEFVRRLLMPDGAVKYLHFVARSGRDRDGRLTYLGSVQDVTERRLAEETLNKVRSELAHASRTMSLGVLTASIAHEVNQPLSGIVTNASTCLRMLAAEPANLEGARSTAQRTLRDANRASDVIQHLRTMFARKEPVTERIALNDAAQEVLALSSSELRDSGITVRTDFDSALPDVIGDRVQLQQVILNLILNAADAMRDTKDRPRDLAIDTIRENEREVRLSVRDSGSGIEPENAAKLFEAFYTTKSKGMGVGLSISRSIVESHAGRIWAMPNDGPGTTFSFTIPCAPQCAVHPTDTKV